MKLNRQEIINAWALKYDGSQYPFDVPRDESTQARNEGVLILFGQSDDLLELRGAIEDEVGAYNGVTISVDKEGVLPRWFEVDSDNEREAEKYFRRKNMNQPKIKIKAQWCPEGSEYSWVISVSGGAATALFQILDGEDKYCLGCVVDAAILND